MKGRRYISAEGIGDLRECLDKLGVACKNITEETGAATSDIEVGIAIGRHVEHLIRIRGWLDATIETILENDEC